MVAPAFIVGSTLFFGLLLLNSYPINATDVYRYVIRGRVAAVYGQSQFVVPPDAFPNDRFAHFAGEWSGETSPYGPVWEGIATAVAAVSQDNLHLGLLIFKGLGLLLHLGTGVVLWAIFADRSPPQRAAYMLLWCWNPALLLTFVVNAHNDSLMLFWLMLGVLLIRSGRHTPGFLIMALAPLTKPIALVTLPFYFIAILRRRPNWRARRQFTAVSISGSLLLAWLAFLPFGSPFDLFNRLLREAIYGAGFSFMALWLLILQRLKLGGVLLSIQIVQGISVLLIIWLLWRAVNGRSSQRGIIAGFAVYFVQALNFRLWYATWIFPWALMDEVDANRPTYRLRVALWFLVTTQLSPLIYGHLRTYALNGDHLLAHIIGVPFTFLLPFILAWKNGR